jgi:hypothetical protein
MTYREDVSVVRTGDAVDLWDKLAKRSDYCAGGNRYTDGMNSIQALLWNMRTSRMPRKAFERGGVTRSSDEAFVMNVERRGHGVCGDEIDQPSKEGRSR